MKLSMRGAKTTEKTKLWFGKHKGETIKSIIDHDPSYLVWCIENMDGFEKSLEEGLAEEIYEADLEWRSNDFMAHEY